MTLGVHKYCMYVGVVVDYRSPCGNARSYVCRTWTYTTGFFWVVHKDRIYRFFVRLIQCSPQGASLNKPKHFGWAASHSKVICLQDLSVHYRIVLGFFHHYAEVRFISFLSKGFTTLNIDEKVFFRKSANLWAKIGGQPHLLRRIQDLINLCFFVYLS